MSGGGEANLFFEPVIANTQTVSGVASKRSFRDCASVRIRRKLLMRASPFASALDAHAARHGTRIRIKKSFAQSIKAPQVIASVLVEVFRVARSAIDKL